MEAVIVQIGHTYHRHHMTDADGHASLAIGRAYTCDVIIPDPYIGACQLRLETSPEQGYHWRASITDKTNPVFLNDKLVATPAFDIRSGDEITIGRTNIRLFAESHGVDETRAFSFTNWLHNHKFKPLIALSSLLLVYCLALFMKYMQTPTEINWKTLSAFSMAFVILSVVWASGWSLANRFLKREYYFFSHLFFTALCMSLLILTSNIQSYVDYMFTSQLAGVIADTALITVIFGLLIGLNLALMTYSPRAFINGIVVSAGIAVTIASLFYLNKNEYNNSPAHSTTIKPAYVPTSAPVGTTDYIAAYDEMFAQLDKLAHKTRREADDKTGED